MTFNPGDRVSEGNLHGTVLHDEGGVLVQWRTDSGRLRASLHSELRREETITMTDAQRAKLQLLCERYGVTFDPNHYLIHPSNAFMMPGWAEGWLGGKPGTLYVGVCPEGDSHS